jgi:hypothetical protein
MHGEADDVELNIHEGGNGVVRCNVPYGIIRKAPLVRLCRYVRLIYHIEIVCVWKLGAENTFDVSRVRFMLLLLGRRRSQ